MENKKEPFDYLIFIVGWSLCPTVMLTHKSPKKWVRIMGYLLYFPCLPIWLITGIPVILCVFVLLISQTIKDI